MKPITMFIQIGDKLAAQFVNVSCFGLHALQACYTMPRLAKTALQNSGYPFPSGRFTVNLAPAQLKKERAGFDLPIAVGILVAMGSLDLEMVEQTVFVGELSLDGRVNPVISQIPVVHLPIIHRYCLCLKDHAERRGHLLLSRMNQAAATG